MSPQVLAGLIASLGLWVWGGLHCQTLSQPGTWLALLLAGLVLELGAVRLPEACFVSLGVTVYAGTYLECGWGPALLLAGVALSARTLARGAPQINLRLYELLEDTLVVFPSLALAGWLGPLAGLFLYAFFSVFLSARLDPAHREAAAWGRFLVVRLGAVGLAAAAMRLGNPLQLLLLPALGSLHLALVHVARQAVPSEEEKLHLELTRRQEQLELQNEELSRARSGLRALSEEQGLMAEMSRAIASARDVGGALDHVLRVAAQLVRCRSLVIWLYQDEQLLAAAYRSPDGERLQGSALTGSVEPSVLAAWERQRPVMMKVEDHPEPIQLAFPIAGFGVIYAGRGEEFSGAEQSHLALVAENSSLALATARRNETFENELDRLSREHRRLQQDVMQLQTLLDGSRRMALALDSKAVLQIAMGTIELLVGADRWLAVLDDRPVLAQGEVGDPAACRVVAESGKPLLVNELASSRLPPPLKGLRSWVCVPLAFESTPLGVLVAGSSSLPMSRRQLDLFCLLAYQAAAALTTLKLQQEVTQSSKLAAVGGLAAGLAHELNNPLGAVQLAIDLASESVESTPRLALSSLEKASRALERSRQIVDSLLLYTREQRSADREPCQLNDLIGDILEMLGPLLDRAGVHIHTQLDPRLPAVSGNPQELRQAISNLVLNARDALENASMKRIELTSSEAEGRVYVQVSDSGPGVDPATAQRIFEPFFTTKPVGKGTGLGLAITNRVAQRHGGRVHVDRSGLGGARFTLELQV